MNIAKAILIAGTLLMMNAPLVVRYAYSQTPVTRAGIPSSAERARMEQEKARQAAGQGAPATAQQGAAKDELQITPVGPQKYAANEVLYKSLQVCEGGKSLPDSRYVVDLQKETVLDRQTGLMWKRCAEGLAGEYCELYAPQNPKARLQSDSHRKYAHSKAWTMRFDELEGAVQRNRNFAGYSGWRVPTIEELKTLRDENCKGPAANDKAFPSGIWGTASLPAIFWTSSTQKTPSNFTMTYSMSLAEGKKFNLNYPDEKQQHSVSIPVRLVRNHP